MAEIIGKQIEVGYAVEATRGTSPASPSKWVKNVSTDIMSRVEKVIDDNSQGKMEDSPNSRVVKKWYDGDIQGILHADVIGYELYNIFGTVTTTTVTGAVRNHVFTMLQNVVHPTLSIYAKDGANYQGVFNTGVVNTLEISASTDDFVRRTTNILCKSANSNSATPSYTTEYDFIGRDITVKIADTEAGLTGATALKLKDMSITFDTGAISDFNFGSLDPDNYNAKLAIEGSFTKNYVDETFKALFESDTAKYMSITIEGDPVLVSSNRPTLSVILNKVQIQGWERSGGNDDLVTEDIEFKAFYNNADSKMATATLKNVTSAYATA